MSDLVIGLLGGGGIASIVGAIVAGLFARRKLGAEATKIITDAASGVVGMLETQLRAQETAFAVERVDNKTKLDNAVQSAQTANDKAEACADETERIKKEWRSEREDWRRVLQLHVAFDHLAIAKLAEHGVDLGDPPPLLPPLPADLGG